MRKRDEDEFQEGDPRLIKTWLLLILIYILFLLWLEPIIDFMMSLKAPDMELGAIERFNDKKEYIATIAFGAARSFPILLFLWFGYQSMITGQLPPKGMRLPFAVRLIKKQNATMLGMFIVAVSLLLLFREFSILSHVHPI